MFGLHRSAPSQEAYGDERTADHLAFHHHWQNRHRALLAHSLALSCPLFLELIAISSFLFFFPSQNFRIYPGLQPKRSGKTVAFTGHITSPGKDTQTAQYRLRVANEAAAAEMTEAIEREVRLVQADSGPSS